MEPDAPALSQTVGHADEAVSGLKTCRMQSEPRETFVAARVEVVPATVATMGAWGSEGRASCVGAGGEWRRLY